jgi:hypothetical protein
LKDLQRLLVDAMIFDTRKDSQIDKLGLSKKKDFNALITSYDFPERFQTYSNRSNILNNLDSSTHLFSSTTQSLKVLTDSNTSTRYLVTAVVIPHFVNLLDPRDSYNELSDAGSYSETLQTSLSPLCCLFLNAFIAA